MGGLREDDSELFGLIRRETERLENTLDLIAAENHPPPSVLEAQGSVFSIKAAEGFPGNRFHAGCRHVDAVEDLAVGRARALFKADHANVQPHSGVSANLAVYFSVLNVGDRILSMKLAHGGHLSHGDPASMTGKCFQFEHYGVHRETESIDYDQVRDMARQFRPKMIVAGASSYARLIDYPALARIAEEVSAYLMVDMAHIAGLVGAGVIPSPVPFSDFVTFTTYKTLGGGRGGVILCRKAHAARLDRAIFPGGQGTPAINGVAAKALCFKLAMTEEFRALQKKVLENAAAFATALGSNGYRLVSGGTENHMVLIDLRAKGVRGNDAEAALESVGIVTNRNMIPFDPEPAGVASGIRIGSPAITARGMGLAEVSRISELIDLTLRHRNETDVRDEVSFQVEELCRAFPIYPDR